MDFFPSETYESSYNVVKSQGATAERASIVNWLRSNRSWTTRVLDRVADAIERGEHLKEG